MHVCVFMCVCACVLMVGIKSLVEKRKKVCWLSEERNVGKRCEPFSHPVSLMRTFLTY